MPCSTCRQPRPGLPCSMAFCALFHGLLCLCLAPPALHPPWPPRMQPTPPPPWHAPSPPPSRGTHPSLPHPAGCWRGCGPCPAAPSTGRHRPRASPPAGQWGRSSTSPSAPTPPPAPCGSRWGGTGGFQRRLCRCPCRLCRDWACGRLPVSGLGMWPPACVGTGHAAARVCRDWACGRPAAVLATTRPMPGPRHVAYRPWRQRRLPCTHPPGLACCSLACCALCLAAAPATPAATLTPARPPTGLLLVLLCPVPCCHPCCHLDRSSCTTITWLHGVLLTCCAVLPWPLQLVYPLSVQQALQKYAITHSSGGQGGGC